MSFEQAIVPSDQSIEDRSESGRLEALQRLDILDSPREEAFDRITRLVRNIFGVKIAAVTLFDAHRQWFKAASGFDAQELPRKDSPCRYVVESGVPLVVEDARLDARLQESGFVTGPPHVRFYASVPLKTTDGHTVGTVCAIDDAPRALGAHDLEVLTDLARIVANEMELRERAAVDHLTGALSRRAFGEQGARAVALAQRHRHNLSCITFDIDFFKTVNDRFGHAAGDTVLGEIARACSAQLRRSDLLGRLGGEEFAVILPYADRHNALAIAEKLRACIAGLEFAFDGEPLGVTASFGVAVIDLATQDFEVLLEHADLALYEAKAAGRNLCLPFGSAPEVDRQPRRRVLKAGRLHFDAHALTIDCTVRSLSADAAGLDVTATFGIPNEFVLAIRSDGLRRRCRVASRTERRLEVEFC